MIELTRLELDLYTIIIFILGAVLGISIMVTIGRYHSNKKDND